MKFKEVEFKYRADDISLKDFQAFALGRKPQKFVYAAGYDHFYANPKDQDSFCRHRVGPDSNQLTFKRKTTDSNNYVRTEHNLDFTNRVSKEQVEALVAEFGYEPNVTLMKNCFIYRFEDHIMVYYTVYDVNMRELGRFIEIEAREDYKWITEQHAWDTIAVVERFSSSLGLRPQARVKRSLWEMFRK